MPADLTGDNFKITCKGRATSPLSVVYANGPRRIVVLLDVSGSMSGQPVGDTGKWRIARSAAWNLVNVLPPQSATSLMTFAEKAEIRAPMSVDRTPMGNWLNGEAARHPSRSLNGHTALYAAVQSAIAQLQPSQPGDVIYVITDGGENASHVRETEVENELRAAGIRLFALIVASGGANSEEERSGPAVLERLSKVSGGFAERLPALSFDSPLLYDDHMEEWIRLHSRRLSMKMAAFYSITVQIPQDSDKSSHLDISVVDGRGRKRKDLSLAYPHRLSPCTVESVQR